MLIAVGLARNCAPVIEGNVRNIYSILANIAPGNFLFLIYENDSRDETSQILLDLQSSLHGLKVITETGVDRLYPERYRRLALCRNRLLQEVFQTIDPSTQGHLMMVDLDDRIGASLQEDQVKLALGTMDQHGLDGVFPVSRPNYYDIFALRAPGWCESDCLELFNRDRSRYGEMAAWFLRVTSKQKSVDEFPRGQLIPVESAFGGVGIYNLQAIRHSKYAVSSNHEQTVCEHVVFNRGLGELAILSDFVVEAPFEHMTWQLESNRKILLKRLGCFIADIRLMVQSLFQGQPR
ncbi:hypothetical protein E2F43_14415 [Seongchinamella unica]|uniref:Uncharacterized protein n=1 Tax=Seongchinamella unica TaxID=2547392 RepID=A0A4R5LQG0_9GAMM|nr:hypothetical protein [Seongchinamella unica]TDG12759.1 hypothetical protein E2F43_14415 [Seongchinamella unica]